MDQPAEGDGIKTRGPEPALAPDAMLGSSFRQSMQLSQGCLASFWSKPLVGSSAGLAILRLVWPLAGRVQGLMRASVARAAAR